MHSIGGFLFAEDKEPVSKTKLTNDTENKVVDIKLIDGVNRLAVDAITVIDQLLGRDPQSTTWLYIGTADDADGVGLAGDTVRIQIPAAVPPLDVLYPAVDVTTTVTIQMLSSPNPERALADAIVSNLNSDVNFVKSWKATVIKDFTGVFINSKIYNEFGERLFWTVTKTGTTRITMAFDDIERRGFSTELARSPNNPRQGILAISGSVSVTPGEVGDTFEKHLRNTLNSENMNINGSVTPVEFKFSCDATKDLYIQNIKVFGNANGIKFGQFLNISTLANGILINIRSNGITGLFSEDPITQTDDLKHHVPDTLSNFRLDIQAGRDDVAAFREYENPFIIKKCGTNGTLTDDSIIALVRDNLSSLQDFEISVSGFKREP